MMLAIKQVVLLLSIVLLTCAAPLHQNNESSTSNQSQVTSHVTRVWKTLGNDIIITAPQGFGKPNKHGQSTITVSLRDENTNISIDVVSFIFSVSTEEISNAKLGENSGGYSDEEVPGHNNTDKLRTVNDEEPNEKPFETTFRHKELNSDEELNKSEDETQNLRDDKYEEDQISSKAGCETNTIEDTEKSDKPKFFETTTISGTSLQDNSYNHDSDSDNQMINLQTDQPESTEPSDQPYLVEQRKSLRTALASNSINGGISLTRAIFKMTDPSSEISPVDSEIVPMNAKPILQHIETASKLSTSKENKTDDGYKNTATNPTSSKTPKPMSAPESTANIEVMKNNEEPFFSGSDIVDEYVNDEWQNDPRYYDPYRNHPGYAAEYDPYGEGYDPYQAGYDPYQAGYDPYQAGYDPYGEGYDPYGAGYDPQGAGYDPYGAGYDPYGTKYDPYETGHENQDPYHESEYKDPRNNVEQQTTQAYSLEENESRPTEISITQDNSQSEEQHRSPSSSPSSTPVSYSEGSENIEPSKIMPSEKPSNSSSIEASREMELWPSKGQNVSNSPHNLAVSISEEDTEYRYDAIGGSSSEESVETPDSELESQSPLNQPENQESPDPTSYISVIQESKNIPNQKEPLSQSHVDLIPSLSSEEDDPLVNTIEHIMDHAFIGASNKEDAVVGMNPDASPSDNYISEHRQSLGIIAEGSRESVALTTQSSIFDHNSVPPSDLHIINEDSSENITSNPSSTLQITTPISGGLDNSAEANANTDNDSEESQESQIFTPSRLVPIGSQPNHKQNNEHSNKEVKTEDRKPNKGVLKKTPTKIIATDFWTSFLQALKMQIPYQSGHPVQNIVQRPQNTRRFYQRSSRRQKASSSEEN